MPKGFAITNKGKSALALDIYGEIGGWWDGASAKDVVKALRDAGDGIKTINVSLNSPGGIVFDGLAIYNELKAHSANVLVTVQGMAASAASIVAMAGDTVRIGEGAMLMIHNASGLVYGRAADMREMADSLDKVSGELASIYARRSGASIDDMQTAMDAETWYTGAEAVAAGLADESIADEYDETKRMAACASPLFDNYRNIPSDLRARLSRITNRASVADGADEISTEGGDNMSTPKQDAPPNEARGATYRELKAALPDASAEFLVEQQENEASVEQANAAYMKHLRAQLEAKDAERETAVAEAMANAKKNEMPGVEALGTGNAPKSEESVSPIAEWETEIHALIAQGVTKSKAISMLAKSNPELHAAYIDAYNAERGNK